MHVLKCSYQEIQVFLSIIQPTRQKHLEVVALGAQNEGRDMHFVKHHRMRISRYEVIET